MWVKFKIYLKLNLKLNLLYSGIEFDVTVKLNANRRVTGVLRGFDPFMNLVIDEAVEEAGPNKNEIGMVVSDYYQELNGGNGTVLQMKFSYLITAVNTNLCTQKILHVAI